MDDVCLSDTCNGVDLSSFSNEFKSARFPAVPIALSCSLHFLPITSLSELRLFRFFDRDLSFSDEDVDESSSGWRVNRSNISAGSTAPSDKIRFPPTFALVGAAAFGSVDTDADAATAAEAGTGVDLVIATDSELESNEADESLP